MPTLRGLRKSAILKCRMWIEKEHEALHCGANPIRYIP